MLHKQFLDFFSLFLCQHWLQGSITLTAWNCDATGRISQEPHASTEHSHVHLNIIAISGSTNYAALLTDADLRLQNKAPGKPKQKAQGDEGEGPSQKQQHTTARDNAAEQLVIRIPPLKKN